MIIANIKRFRWVIYLILITLFIWVISSMFASIAGYVLYKMPSPLGKTVNLSNSLGPKERGSLDYSIIQERNIFDVKQSVSSSSGNVGSDTTLPVAEMGVSLRGTITGPKWFARAIIEDMGKQSLYKIGDEIRGATIKAISRNKVILEVNGQEQMLVVETAPVGEAIKGSKTTTTKTNISGSGTSGIKDFNTLVSSMQPYLGKTKISPYSKGGESYGLRAGFVDRTSLAYELGARSGDILKGANGISIKTQADAMKAFESLKKESSVTVEIERQGKTMSIIVPVQQIAKTKK
jgi:general secretion pathway protein C